MQEQHAVRARRRIHILAAAVGLGLAGLASPAWPADDLPAFGMLGLARGQTAILSLVLVGPPDADHPGCRVTASFVDARGQVFGPREASDRGEIARRTFVLRPQMAEELRLKAADILGAGEQRTPVRAVLAPSDDGNPSDCACLVASRENVEADGRTSVIDVKTRPEGGGNPPPPPTAPCRTVR
jgi:hypothetical protein